MSITSVFVDNNYKAIHENKRLKIKYKCYTSLLKSILLHYTFLSLLIHINLDFRPIQKSFYKVYSGIKRYEEISLLYAFTDLSYSLISTTICSSLCKYMMTSAGIHPQPLKELQSHE